MSNTARSWMYDRLDADEYISPIFTNGLKTFIEFACSNQSFMDGDKIKCPCKKCLNRAFQEVEVAKFHLSKFGFIPNYYLWNKHGETSIGSTSFGMDDTHSPFNEHHDPSYSEMVMDVAGYDFIGRTFDEDPNPEDKKFFDMLEAADRELWSGCKKATQLSVAARLLNIKSEYRIHEQCFNAICQSMKDGLPEDNNMVDSLYETKKLIQALGLPVEHIDCCRSGCMLYWRDNKDLDQCKFCEAQRYKSSTNSSKCSRVAYTRMHYLPLTPRLKRLYASQAIVASMRWHAEDHGHDVGVM
ncbi:uncharacterized protein LOC111909581 [Lactuca sativa]|uniref:uncharacterized protein LOC111909581 n=1 Tax=Lactuca sativa TaxID=4236 RepID=UPI0022AFCB92|nr:uncharacterized protein LOC111909581 [Lactuca sativa]